ncbi:spermidine synthase [Thermophilibacter provencensis]|uniref:Fused MFS/spermidine synthase n=1 Tax=Thermophilibacter provencensis TaxID=1852386 RepID=A0ABT7V4U7_9ACTN|nr:fused MFS/spermidine synthase [Thermophilibacter provencensis]MDM8271620.1 fused MFS/spermidine synthase [Thermophilibacter provencensis]
MTELICALLVLTVVCTAILALMPWALRRRGVELRRTKFGLTLIFESENLDGTPVRLLNVNGTFQSGCYVPDDLHFELACEYHRAMAGVIEGLARRDAGRPVRVMVMGGGGYSLPKYLAAYVPAARTDAVEVDPAITAIAREFFFLDECLEKTGAEKDGRLRLVNDDAWAFLRAAAEPYDVIVNDAFSGKRPLGPLTSAEGARVVRSRLAENGVYLANVRCACTGRGAGPLREVEGAFGREFAHVGYVPEWPDEPEKPGNNAFIATDAEGVLPADAVVVK